MESKWLVLMIFAAVWVAIVWRPRRFNEAIPALLGAGLVFLLGLIDLADVKNVLHIVSGAAIITLSTIIMSSVLDRTGFFRLAAERIAKKAAGSGRKLFFYSLLLSFLMTLFFNNDGSILITTPILIQMTKNLQLTKAQALPILLGSALVATSSSAPIGVSNISNLIALTIVGLDLNTYAELMFIPAMIGIVTCAALIYWLFRKNIAFSFELSPKHYPKLPVANGPAHPPRPPFHAVKPLHAIHERQMRKTDTRMMKFGVATVILVRFGFFVASAFQFPPQYVALTGAGIMLWMYTFRHAKRLREITKDIPWQVILFAIGMYMLVYALKNVGITTFIGHLLQMWAGHTLIGYILLTGIILTIMSSAMNNLPAVMIGTITVTSLQLPSAYVKLSYLAGILGSDIGSLLLPIGTLASLLWFHLVSRSIRITWKEYIFVSFIVIPPSLVVSLIALWLWGRLII